MHIVVAAMAVNWFHYYILLWWLVAYRYLDVGPRRALQKLYNTPQKLAARPWAPTLNWAVIFSIYVLAFLAVYNRKILFAKVPGSRRLGTRPGALGDRDRARLQPRAGTVRVGHHPQVHRLALSWITAARTVGRHRPRGRPLNHQRADLDEVVGQLAVPCPVGVQRW